MPNLPVLQRGKGADGAARPQESVGRPNGKDRGAAGGTAEEFALGRRRVCRHGSCHAQRGNGTGAGPRKCDSGAGEIARRRRDFRRATAASGDTAQPDQLIAGAAAPIQPSVTP